MSDKDLLQELENIEAKQDSLTQTFKKREHWMTTIQFWQWMLGLVLLGAGGLITYGGKQVEKQAEIQGMKDNLSRFEVKTIELTQSLDSNDKRHDAQIKAINDNYIMFKAQLEALDKKADANAKEVDRKLDLVIQMIRGQK